MATPYDINSTIQSYLNAYSGGPATPSETINSMATDTAEANLGNSQNLKSLSALVNNINQTAQQSANLSRTGYNPQYDQQQLQSIYNLGQGYVSPETTREAEAAAAQQWGGSGFGVDTPAWQSAVRRTLGLKREDLQKQGADQYAQYLQTHEAAPIYDISKSLVTPDNSQAAWQNYENQRLQLAKMKNDMAIAEMNARATVGSKLFDINGRGLSSASALYPAFSTNINQSGSVTGASTDPLSERRYQDTQQRAAQQYAQNVNRMITNIIRGGSYPGGY